MQPLLNTFNEFKLYFDALPVPVSVVDDQGHYLYCNIAFYKDFLRRNYSPFALLGKKNTDLMNQKLASLLDSNHYLTLKLGGSQFFDEYIEHENGDNVCWLSLKKPVMNFAGEPQFLINVFIDITERKLNEKKLGLDIFDDNNQPLLRYIYGNQSVLYLDQGSKVMSKRLCDKLNNRSILSNLQALNFNDPASLDLVAELFEITLLNFPGNIYVKNSENIIKFINLNLSRDCGVNDYNTVLGQKEEDALPLNFSKKQAKMDKKVLGSDQVYMFEEPVILNDSDRCYLSFKRRVINPSNKEKLLVGISIDYTLQKQLDTNIRCAINSQSINQKSKETFVTSLSHDIRTPITGMLGLISKIKTDVDNLPKLSNKINALESLTNEFLSFFNGILQSIDNKDINALSDDKNQVNVRELVNKCVSLFKPSLMYQDIHLTTFFTNTVPSYINVNERIIKQILINLIGNAIKFSDKGEVKVVVTYENNKNLDIFVSDQGIGINETDFEKIFEQFTRLDLSPNSKYAGSGLGLYMVKKYVLLLNGSINVKSKLGCGSTFSVSIPVEKMLRTSESSEIQDSSLSDISYKFSNKHVLIVEDNKLAGIALKNNIEKLGFKVDVVETGKQALKLIVEKSYLCMFLDLGLPDQSGLDVLVSAKQKGCTKAPVFVLSGHVSNQMYELCMQAGASGIYTKPMLIPQIKKAFSFCD